MLGETVLKFGRALLGTEWRDDDLVQANALPPKPPVLGNDEISDMLESVRNHREQKFYAARQRAEFVIGYIIDEARNGLLELFTQPTKGGPIVSAPPEYWDRERSRHIFKGCVVSPAQPFRVAPPKEWHNIYCKEEELGERLRKVPGAKARRVGKPELEKAIVEHANMSQGDLLKKIAERFAERAIPPSADSVKKLDRELRASGNCLQEPLEGDRERDHFSPMVDQRRRGSSEPKHHARTL